MAEEQTPKKHSLVLRSFYPENEQDNPQLILAARAVNESDHIVLTHGPKPKSKYRYFVLTANPEKEDEFFPPVPILDPHEVAEAARFLLGESAADQERN